jgi:two-component system chemotaxis sensor kinase CheA
MVRCAEQFFGIPLSSVDSLLTAQQALLRVGRKRIQVEHRGQVLQVSDLGVLLGLRPLGMVEEGKPLMVLRSNGRQLALAVDEILGDRDLVIRPLPPELRTLPAYQGAAVLAQGQLMLIVRSEWLTDPERLLTTVTSAGHRALVVDDSLTARALHRAALESGGFLVHTASSAQQALEQLATGSYDVVVCDLMMSAMDGATFTQRIRARPDTRAIPVVLVSARDAESDRARGLAAGADAFLSKKDCASGRLLSEVAAVMSRVRRSA